MNARRSKCKRIRIGYFCSYVPVGLMEHAGFEMVYLSGIPAGNCSAAGLSGNLCSYVRKLQICMDSLDIDGIVFTNCCNSAQRFYDYVKTKKTALACYMLELPRRKTPADMIYFRRMSLELLANLCAKFSVPLPEPFDWREQEGDLESGSGKGTIYVIGNAMSKSVEETVKELASQYAVEINNCASRHNGNALERYYSAAHDVLQPNHGEQLIPGAVPCPRMEDFHDWFEALLNQNKSIKGVLYICSKNCDIYLFSYPAVRNICSRFGVPVLFVEQEYGEQPGGQFQTRLEAFLESLVLPSERETGLTGDRNEYPAFVQRMRIASIAADSLPLKAVRDVVRNQIDMITKKAFQSPERVVWTNMAMTTELLYAAGLIPINIELLAGWLSSLGLSSQCIRSLEQKGFSSSVCSYHKAALGLLEKGGLPPPAGMAVTSNICDGGVGAAFYCAHRYGTKTFVLNVPFTGKTEDNLSYMNQQYTEFISWIEQFTGREFSMDKLAVSLKLSNHARKYWLLAQELRKGRPLIPGYLSLRNLFGGTFLFGSKLGVTVAEEYYRQLLQIGKAQTERPPDTKKRVLWVHFAPLYGKQLMNYIENELGCPIVMDITAHIYWDEHDTERPLESLSKRALSHFYLGEPSQRVELYKKMIRDYRIDAVIQFMQKGCRAIPGSSFLVRRAADECGAAYLELFGDCIDPGDYSEEQMRLRLSALCESMGM